MVIGSISLAVYHAVRAKVTTTKNVWKNALKRTRLTSRLIVAHGGKVKLKPVKILTLNGQLYSKANSRRIALNRRTGKIFSIKSQNALDCVRSMQAQAKAQWCDKPLVGDVKIAAIIYYQSRRADLDGELLCDLLQGICYANDRQIVWKVFYKKLDTENPRVVVAVCEMKNPEDKKNA